MGGLSRRPESVHGGNALFLPFRQVGELMRSSFAELAKLARLKPCGLLQRLVYAGLLAGAGSPNNLPLASAGTNAGFAVNQFNMDWMLGAIRGFNEDICICTR